MRKIQVREDWEQRLKTMNSINPNITYSDIIKIYDFLKEYERQ